MFGQQASAATNLGGERADLLILESQPMNMVLTGGAGASGIHLLREEQHLLTEIVVLGLQILDQLALPGEQIILGFRFLASQDSVGVSHSNQRLRNLSIRRLPVAVVSSNRI
jgi:hypothetical protein